MNASEPSSSDEYSPADAPYDKICHIKHSYYYLCLSRLPERKMLFTTLLIFPPLPEGVLSMWIHLLMDVLEIKPIHLLTNVVNYHIYNV